MHLCLEYFQLYPVSCFVELLAKNPLLGPSPVRTVCSWRSIFLTSVTMCCETLNFLSVSCAWHKMVSQWSWGLWAIYYYVRSWRRIAKFGDGTSLGISSKRNNTWHFWVREHNVWLLRVWVRFKNWNVCVLYSSTNKISVVKEKKNKERVLRAAKKIVK